MRVLSLDREQLLKVIGWVLFRDASVLVVSPTDASLARVDLDRRLLLAAKSWRAGYWRALELER